MGEMIIKQADEAQIHQHGNFTDSMNILLILMNVPPEILPATENPVTL